MELFFVHNKIIDGRAFAGRLLDDVREKVDVLSQKPCLAVVLVGDHAPSQVYVDRKRHACEKVGIESRFVSLPENISEEVLIQELNALNQDPAVHGILLQLPLPSHINQFRAIEAISPLKDVDGLTSANLGRLFAGKPRFIPCTPLGCLLLLEGMTSLRGKTVAIVGRSVLVGKSLAVLLAMKDATVTLTHRHTLNLKETTQNADIVIAAAGQPGLIAKDHIKPGAIVLDVGITRVDGKLVGDVIFEEAREIASAITPVPGGIGPLTIASLMMNTLKAFERR